MNDFSKNVAVNRGNAAWFDDDGIAGYQSRAHFAGDQEEWEVPRQNAGDYAQRTFEQ